MDQFSFSLSNGLGIEFAGTIRARATAEPPSGAASCGSCTSCQDPATDCSKHGLYTVIETTEVFAVRDGARSPHAAAFAVVEELTDDDSEPAVRALSSAAELQEWLDRVAANQPALAVELRSQLGD